MKTHRILALAATVAMTSCGTFGGQAVTLEETGVMPASRWQGSISSPRSLAGAVQMTGSAWMAPLPGSSETQVSVTLENAAPGGVHPWAVHTGRCGSDRGIFGSSSDLEPLEVDDDGEASATGTLSVQPTASQDYFISILASPSNRQLVVACANLAPPIG